MGVLEAQDGVIVGVVWPLSSSLASGPLTILMNTSGLDSHTPLAGVIK